MESGEQLYLDSNIKFHDLKDFLKAQFGSFRCQNMWKYVKNRVHGKEGTTLPWALKKCTRSLYFTLLVGEGEGGDNLPLLVCKVIRNSNSSCINLAYFICKQCRVSRNALLTKLHCRSYASLILKRPISPSLSSILNSLILSKSIKAGLKQLGKGGTGSPHKIINSGKFLEYLLKILWIMWFY